MNYSKISTELSSEGFSKTEIEKIQNVFGLKKYNQELYLVRNFNPYDNDEFPTSTYKPIKVVLCDVINNNYLYSVGEVNPIYYTFHCIGKLDSGAWRNISVFETEEDALHYIKCNQSESIPTPTEFKKVVDDAYHDHRNQNMDMMEMMSMIVDNHF